MTNRGSTQAIIAIDVGGTKTAGGLWFPEEGLCERHEQPTRVGSMESVIQSITSTVDWLQRRSEPRGPVRAIGIGIPGQVDTRQGVVYSPLNLGFSEPVPLKSAIEARYRLPVFLDNDTNLGAAGEARFGTGVDFDNFVYLAIGTGVGAGIVIDGKVYHGANGLAGEVGHMSITRNGPECACGGRGCVENLVSGRAIAERVNQLLAAQRGLNSVLRTALGQQKQVTPEDVFSAARQGDQVAGDIISGIVCDLGTLLSNLTNILDPEAIILGGGVIQNVFQDEDLLLRPLDEFLSERAKLNKRNRVRIMMSSLGRDAVILGAVALCLDRLDGCADACLTSLRESREC